MTKKGKRARITPDGEAFIVEKALAHPRLPRTLVAEKTQAEFKNKNWSVPQLEVLEKKISKYRTHQKSPQDKPWSIATLRDYPVHPEVLPKVLELWKFRLDMNDKYGEEGEGKLTIRQARWAAQLSAIKPPKHRVTVEGREDAPQKDILWLNHLATWYAAHENASELTGRPFDTEGDDHSIIGLLIDVGVGKPSEMTLNFTEKEGEEE